MADASVAAVPKRRRLRRTWPQRLVLGVNTLLVVILLAAAFGVWYAYHRLGQLERVTITHAAPSTVGDGGSTPTTAAATPPASNAVQNFLLVGADSRAEACVDPNSPYAGGFGDVSSDLSDTIMVVRIDPKTSQAAILSFPRDLWVSIAGTGRKSKINSAYEKDDPSRLVQTIEQNFGITVDHYVEVSFCAFKNLVDAVGGVKIPFAYPTRDLNTGLNIPAPACVSMNGDEALAYVRSRHYEYSTDGGKHWLSGGDDYGRIARQQDFIRRALQKAIDKGARSPAVAKDLIDVALKPGNVRVDDKLTLSDLLGLATTLHSFDPGQLEAHSYRIDGHGELLGGQSVIMPDLNAPTTKAVLQVFRGQAQLGDAPAPPPTTPDTGASPTTSTTSTTLPPKTAPTTTVPGATTTLPTVNVAPNNTGVTPPDDPSCR